MKPKLKPRPKPKKCAVGVSCGSTCIEKSDACQTTIKNKDAINNFHQLVQSSVNRDGSNQAVFEKISAEMDALFNTPEADKIFREAAANFDKKSDVRLTGDIRHQLKNGEYDRILDRVRAESGLDSRAWRKTYDNVKNVINGKMTKRLLDSKGNCK